MMFAMERRGFMEMALWISAAGSEVIELRKQNFNIESLGPAEVWTCDGLVVGAAQKLKRWDVMKTLKANRAKQIEIDR
jgi:hypothetical protein